MPGNDGMSLQDWFLAARKYPRTTGLHPGWRRIVPLGYFLLDKVKQAVMPPIDAEARPSDRFQRAF